MTSELLLAQARRHDNVVARWALLRDGMTPRAVRHQTRGLLELDDGVFLLGAAAPTRRQRRWAAVLTAPHRHLCAASAADALGIRAWDGGFETVVAPGNAGPRRSGGVLLCRSTTLRGNTTTTADGLPTTTAARTLADLAPGLGDRELERAVREALRLRLTTCAEVQALLARSAPRNRSARLRALAARYARLPIARTRSDPEAHALAVLAAAGVPAPRANVVIAGWEADLSWPRWRRILELDGPDFHQFPDEDRRRQAAWEQAGWTVLRLPTGDVYDHPARLLALAPTPGRGSAGRR